MQNTISPKPAHAEPLTPYRKSLLNRVHDTAYRLGLDDGGYRLCPLAFTGSKTAVKLTNAEILQACKDLESLDTTDYSAQALAGLID